MCMVLSSDNDVMLCNDIAVPTIPTVGFNVETVRYRGSMFSVCDVGGQDKV